MPIAKETGAPRDPIPQGTHHAVCYAVVDLGTQSPLPNAQYAKGPQRKVMFMFEVPEERIDVERDGQTVSMPRAISKEFTLMLGEKANLRKFLTAWRGKQFTPEELKGFDLKNVLGANCMLNIIHNAKGYADIAAVMKLPKGMPQKQAENELVNYDIEDEIPKSLPEWVRNKILASEEKRNSGHGPGRDDYEPPPPHTDEDEEPPF